MTNAKRIKTGTLISVEVCPQGYHVAVRSQRANKRWEHDITTADVVNLVARTDPDHVQVQLIPSTLALFHDLCQLPLKNPVQVFGGGYAWGDCDKWPAACGGLRPRTKNDLVVASIQVGCLRELDVEEICAAAEAHPVWRYLTFPLGHCPFSIAAVMSIVIDPRMHVLPHAPDGVDRLRRLLGVPRSCGRPPKAEYTLVQQAWGADEELDPSDPRAFLHRFRQSVIDDGYAHEEATVRTSRRYVAYLQKTWFESIRTTGTESVFDAERVIDTEDAIKALKSYVSRVDAGDPLL